MQTDTQSLGKEEADDSRPIRPRKQRAAIFYELADRHGSYVFVLGGVRKTLKEWAQVSKVPLHNLYQRIFILGWNIEQATKVSLYGRRNDHSPLEDKEGKTLPRRTKKERPLDATPFISEGVYAGYVIIEGEENMIVSDLRYDFEAEAWGSEEYPMCKGRSRKEACLGIMSLIEGEEGLVIDEESYQSLSEADLTITYKEVDDAD
jgi:hypothetical protein